MSSSIQLKRLDQIGMSTMIVNTEDTDIEVRVISRLGKKGRRSILRSFFRQIRPWLTNFLGVSIDHADHGSVLRKRSVERGLKPFNGLPLGADQGKLGFEIQQQRLKMGLSQQEFAELIGITRQHLSALERGLSFPRAGTLVQIQKALTLDRIN